MSICSYLVPPRCFLLGLSFLILPALPAAPLLASVLGFGEDSVMKGPGGSVAIGQNGRVLRTGDIGGAVVAFDRVEDVGSTCAQSTKRATCDPGMNGTDYPAQTLVNRDARFSSLAHENGDRSGAGGFEPLALLIMALLLLVTAYRSLRTSQDISLGFGFFAHAPQERRATSSPVKER